MTAKQLEEHLTVITAKAKALREAGVVGKVSIAHISFELAEVIEAAPANSQAQEPKNPLDDPDTFGGHLPQPRVPKQHEFEDDEE